MYTGKMLLEHETMKLKEQEETYMKELKEWKAQLKPRKQVRHVTKICTSGFHQICFYFYFLPSVFLSKLYRSNVAVTVFTMHL